MNSTVVAALVRRDRLIVMSYRLSFVLELFHGIVGLALYYFISKTFAGFSSSDLGPAPTYFAYAAVGIIMGGVLDATSSGVGYRIREEQVTGTLEAVSTAPVTSLDLCLGLMGFPFFFASARAAFYLVVAAILMGLDVGSTSSPGIVLVFLATGAAMAPIGILAGAAVLVMKRGQLISGTLVFLMSILAGMVFPVSVLPDGLEALSALIPLRYAFDGARQALFAGTGWEGDVLALVAFAVVLWPLSVLLFGKAGAWARRAGSCRSTDTGIRLGAVAPDYACRVAVPFMDLARHHASLSTEILRDLAELMDAGTFVNGPAVTRFEEAFAADTGVARCVGIASGLDALRLALIAAGLEPGDEVIVPAMTFVATLEAVTQAGGVPSSPTSTRTTLTSTRTPRPPRRADERASCCPCTSTDSSPTCARSRSLELPLIEDACQAHGRRARRASSRGGAGSCRAFSFYPGKNLGAMGDAGALVTDDGALAERVRALREHGQ